MEPYAAEWWSIVPPIVAIGLALLTKEVFSSLLVGIFTGTLIYAVGTDANIVMGTLETAFTMMAKKVDFNILIFCSLLVALVYLISLPGGTAAYGKASTKIIRGRRSSLAATGGLGIAIFIDDYFNCLTVGTVMRPITDAYKISRAKLAYIIDSTAAPVCIIAPISSWAAAVGSSLKDTGVFESELGAFVATIPWNFYAIFPLLLVFSLCCTAFDFGPMRPAEEQASRQSVDATASGGTSDDKLKYNPNGTTWDMLVPLGALIVFAVMALMYTGGYWGADAKYHTFMAAIGNSSASISLVFASFGALIVALLMYVPRKLMTFAQFAEGSVEGMKLMLPANIILILAWTLSGLCFNLHNEEIADERSAVCSSVHAACCDLFGHGSDVPARDRFCDCRFPGIFYGDGLGYVRYLDSNCGADCRSARPESHGGCAFGYVGGFCFRRSLLADFRHDDSVFC